MNAKTMKVVLESTAQSTQAICNLKELLAESSARIDSLKRLIGCGNMDAEQTEKAIKDMIAERSELLSVRRQSIALTGVLDAVGDLPREPGETTTSYAERLVKVFVARSGAAAEYQALAEKRLNDLAELHIKIAKLETRESELIALHDAIEYLSGFPMQPQESYAEYLQRLAADRAQLAEAVQNTCSNGELAEALRERDKARTELASEREQLTTHKLLQLNLVHQRDGALDAAKSAQSERDNFRARWEESLAERDRATEEARRTSEANQALQHEVTLRSQILARIMIDPSTDKLFNERDWNDAARKVLIEARGMVSDDTEAKLTTKGSPS